MLKRILIAAVAGAGLVAALASIAAEPATRYNSVELQADAQREVKNDLFNASMFVELSDANPAALADAVNKSVNEALRVAKDSKNVRVRSGNNQTYPVYSRANVVQSWRARAEIRIESKDFEAASVLIGKLQSSMQLGNTTFTVSPEARRATENELITEAIAAFKARADIIKSALGGRSYKLQRLNVANGYNAPQPRMFAAARVASSSAEVAPPNFEAGVSVVTVTASGAIEVIE